MNQEIDPKGTRSLPEQHGDLCDRVSSRNREHSPYNPSRTSCTRSSWRRRGPGRARSSWRSAPASATAAPSPRSPFWLSRSPAHGISHSINQPIRVSETLLAVETNADGDWGEEIPFDCLLAETGRWYEAEQRRRGWDSWLRAAAKGQWKEAEERRKLVMEMREGYILILERKMGNSGAAVRRTGGGRETCPASLTAGFIRRI